MMQIGLAESSLFLIGCLSVLGLINSNLKMFNASLKEVNTALSLLKELKEKLTGLFK